MNNQEKLTALLAEELYPPLREAIDDLLEVYEDSEDNPDYDSSDAFWDIWDRDHDGVYGRFIIRACNQIAVQVGLLIPRDPKKQYIGQYYWATVKGVQYTAICPAEWAGDAP